MLYYYKGDATLIRAPVVLLVKARGILDVVDIFIEHIIRTYTVYI